MHRQDALGAALPLRPIWSPLVAVIAAMLAAWIALYYSHQPLLEHEAWRQTQTALTSYWMLEEGWQLAYQTPVLGYPWQIPLEFPIYQSIVALIVWLGDFPLDPTGRIVSFGFLLACAWPAFQIARRLELPREAPWLFCALLWSAPIYLFYGRNFLMETAALFFVFAAIPYALDLRRPHPRLSSGVAFALFATFGLLQKVTTAFPILLGMAIILLILHFHEHRLSRPGARKIAVILLSIAIPGAIALFWLLYAGSVRSENYIMAGIHSNESMIQDWFGGHRLRMSPEALLLVFWERIVAQNGAGLMGIAILMLGTLLGSWRLRATIVSAGFLCLLPSYMFIRHHHFLDYYQTANVLFLSGALSVSMASIAVRVQSSIAAPILCAAVVAVNFYTYTNTYGHYVQRTLNAENDATLAVSDVVRRYTPAGSAVIVFGLMSRGSLKPISAWSSEVAYYSERKSLTVSNSADALVWSDPASFIGDKELGAIVFCSTQERERYQPILDRYGSQLPPALFKVSDCHIWLPGVESIVLANGEMVRPTRSFD